MTSELHYAFEDLNEQQRRCAIGVVAVMFNIGILIERMKVILRFVGDARPLAPIQVGAYRHLTKRERVICAAIVLAAYAACDPDTGEAECVLKYLSQAHAVDEVLDAWFGGIGPRVVTAAAS